MKTVFSTRLASASLLGALATLFIAGCSESTETAETTQAAEPMVAANPAPRTHADESVSFFSEGGKSVPVTTTAAPVVKSTPAPAVSVAAGPTLPTYVSEHAVRGRMRSIGSDTMDNIMEDWEKAFKGYNPGIRVIHEGKGSSTAIPALVEGRSDFGPMSRAVKPAEVEKFEQQFGYAPTSMPVAIDALAVYVNPANPIAREGLSLSQLDAIFSSTRRRGVSEDIKTWGDLGLTGDWANKPITVYSRNKASGTYGFFKDHVLKKGDYKTTNIELPGSAEVVRAVENDPYAIGYSGFGYKTSGVAVVPLAESDGAAPVEANQVNAVSGAYPLARNLFLTINHQPGTELKPLQAEFIRFVYSRNGQDIVVEDGFFPVSVETAQGQLGLLGLAE